MKFQGNSSKGSRDTREKVFGFPSEIPNFCSLWRMNKKKDITFQENPSNGSRDTCEKVLF
jgi:hypothetical protein